MFDVVDWHKKVFVCIFGSWQLCQTNESLPDFYTSIVWCWLSYIDSHINIELNMPWRQQYVFIWQEGSSSVDIVVDRQGGSLITQYVQYTVHPNGGAEFYGYTNVLKFNPGVMTMSAALLPIADGVPEVCTLKNIHSFPLYVKSKGQSVSLVPNGSLRQNIVVVVLNNVRWDNFIWGFIFSSQKWGLLILLFSGIVKIWVF
jgi:hypothetical protein